MQCIYMYQVVGGSGAYCTLTLIWYNRKLHEINSFLASTYFLRSFSNFNSSHSRVLYLSQFRRSHFNCFLGTFLYRVYDSLFSILILANTHYLFTRFISMLLPELWSRPAKLSLVISVGILNKN